MTTTRRQQTVDGIARDGVVGIVRVKDASTVRALCDAFIAGGVRAIEITMTVPGAVDLIHALSSTVPDDCLLGAGTVIDARMTERVIAAGARFVVSPVFRRDIIEVCQRADVVSVPGCFSPTEIFEAAEAGADIVKVFPATVLGPSFVREIRAPLPHLKLMPTGGLSIDSVGDWICAGASAVGLGVALIDRAALAAGDLGPTTANARRAVAAVQTARSMR